MFSYGPWADKQRALIYSYFFPSDYGCMPVTEMPKKGERRILINHDVRISLLHDASIDFWFMRSDELNAIHSRVKQGSSFEVGYSTCTCIAMAHMVKTWETNLQWSKSSKKISRGNKEFQKNCFMELGEMRH